ncbi:hypothetical protein [Crocosphaera sp. XPORK-15E]|uniref:hypothetical protein n=1 Tax=Crocosphaera sp. XPORK-15E TaxID=3110247 RepID=UPI002B20FCB8|nr:hypothetical protein [Crocosphaera sp. XPORK-15E]MEA5537036.1 hypothetical protein [Crocosphaera sp. XPORK-15E]
MSSFNPDEITRQIFRQVRQELNLGMGEYLAALEAIKGGYGTQNESDLQEVLQLLWCHSVEEQAQFQLEWKEIVVIKEASINPPIIESDNFSPTTTNKKPDISAPLSQVLPKIYTPQPIKHLAGIPVQSPPFKPVQDQSATPFHTYYPVTRRTMAYNWRYLRRLIPDGPEAVFDVDATIKLTADQGFFLKPVFIREKRNNAHLLLLIDQNGSMTPFHHFTRDLVETAKYESTLSPERVDVAYFHNIPAEYVYQDVYLTQPMPLVEVMEKCDSNTSIIIISDAGAARGYRRLPRIRETTRVLRQLKRYTNEVAWLNPMPPERWEGSSAQVLQYLIPMFPLDDEGLSQAIDVVRGQISYQSLI